jgi:protein O-mannosyl-transferase
MEALEALDHSIAINQYPKAYFTRAILHEATGKTDLALADIDKVLNAEPNNTRALCVRGDCLEKSGKQEEAMKCYNQAIVLSANEPLFYMRRGILFGKMNNFPSAISDLDVAISLNPGNGEALFYRGIFKHKSARGGACQDLERALKYGYMRAKAAIADICAAR